jgi:hypothetical protein
MRLQKKELMELVATSFLIIVLLFVVVRAVARVENAKRSRSGKAAGVVTTGSKPAKPAEPAQPTKQAQPVSGDDLKMKRDPFTGISFVTVEKAETLSGILWSQEHPLAIINEAIVKIGDKVGASIVTDIRQDRVILSDGAKETELRLE